MFSAKLAKYAIAAMLAFGATPLLATTVKKTTRHPVSKLVHHTTSSSAKKLAVTKHTVHPTARTLHTTTSVKSKTAGKLSTASTTHKVKLTKTPVSIDSIHT